MFRTLKSPLCWLWVAYVFFSLNHYLEFSYEPGGRTRHAWLEAVVLGFIAACWISRDANGKRSWPVDHSMTFYPLLFPAYMIVTRKWKGVLWIIAVWLGYRLTYLLPSLLLRKNA